MSRPTELLLRAGSFTNDQPVGAASSVRSMLAFAQSTPRLTLASGVTTTERLSIASKYPVVRRSASPARGHRRYARSAALRPRVANESVYHSRAVSAGSSEWLW